MVYAIIIATQTDGTKVAVGGPQKLSAAKAVLRSLDGEGLKMAELFELRKHSKRRKFSLASGSVGASMGEEPPTTEEIAQLLFKDPALISDDGYGSDGIPNVKAMNKAFGVKFNASERDAVWALVEKLADGLLAGGVDALAAALEIPAEELEEAMEREDFPDPHSSEEGTGDPIYDVAEVREFMAALGAASQTNP